jgi:hypothetical protein
MRLYNASGIINNNNNTMKHLLLLTAALAITTATFSQQAVIAKWTFPSGNAVDTLPDEANALNLTKSIFTAGGASGIAFKNGATTKAAQATGWNNGKDTKAWQIGVNTTGNENINVSSKHTAGGNNPGPRDMKLQYRIGDGAWTDVTGGAITVGNDWTSGVLTSLALPAECGNQPALGLRWVMTSNLDSNGTELVAGGISKVDDIIVTGQTASGINDNALSGTISIFPNPCSDFINIESEKPVSRIEVYSIGSEKVIDQAVNSTSALIKLKGIAPGRYFVVIHSDGNNRKSVKSLIINR